MIDYFLEKKVSTVISLLLLFIVGIISFRNLNVELFPNLAIPTITVVTEFENASPDEVEVLITKPIEEALSSTEGAEDIYSESLEGTSIIKVKLKWGTDLDLASITVREKLDLVKGNLPIDAKKSILLKFDPNDEPLITIAIYNNNFDFQNLRAYVKKNIVPILERTDGIATVSISGGYERRILVELDSAKLRAYSLSTQQIVSQLKENNINLPSGNLIVDKEEILIRMFGLFLNIEDIENLNVKITESGIPVPLKNIAKITDSFKEPTSYTSVNGRNCLILELRKESIKNSLVTSRNVDDTILEIRNKFNEILTIKKVNDKSSLIISSSKDVAFSIFLSILLCFIVLTFFIGTYKQTLVVTLTIPIALFFVFVAMNFLQQSLNLLTLGGLAVGIGLMVDSSIVVLESILKESKNEHYTMTKVVGKGVKTIVFALVISNLTSIVVFLPNLYLKGLAGIVFKDFAITICICLGCSLLVSLIYLPFFSVYFSDSNEIVPVSKFRKFTSQTILFIENKYRKNINQSLSNHKIIILAGIISIFLSFPLIVFLPKEMMPSIERKTIKIEFKLSNGKRLKDSIAFSKKIGDLVTQIDKDAQVIFNIGYEKRSMILNPRSEFGINRGFIDIHFTSFARKDKFLDQLNNSKDFNEGSINIETGSDILAEVLPYSFDKIDIEISGTDLKTIEKSVIQVKSSLVTILEQSAIKSTLDEKIDELLLIVDRDKMSQFGISADYLGKTIRNVIRGDENSNFRVNDDEIPILVRASEEYRTGEHSILNLNLMINENISVRISDFAKIVKIKSQRVIYRHNGKKIAQVSVEVLNSSLGDTYNRIEKLFKINEFDNFGNFIQFGENRKVLDSSIWNLSIALGFSILLVYMTLAASMESYLLPLVILFSIFLSILGVCSSLILFNESLNMMSLLGSILLVGIVVNNAILIVEYYRDNFDKYKDKFQLIVEGGMKRLIPILSTTLTSTLGLLPLLFPLTESSSQRSLAAAIFGGLIISTFISLFFIPAVCYELIRQGRFKD
ncbi:MAG: efflux RND transporter permease subunit [Leptospira sp.]|nr:efflux RND transporter permease subunit [Leptospira sp.]